MTMYNAKQIYIIGRLNIKIKLLIFHVLYQIYRALGYSAIRYLKRICIKMYFTITFLFYPFKSFIYHVLSHHQLIALNHLLVDKLSTTHFVFLISTVAMSFWHLSPKSTLKCVIVVLIVISIYILRQHSNLFQLKSLYYRS